MKKIATVIAIIALAGCTSNQEPTPSPESGGGSWGPEQTAGCSKLSLQQTTEQYVNKHFICEDLQGNKKDLYTFRTETDRKAWLNVNTKTETLIYDAGDRWVKVVLRIGVSSNG